ncbi:hypothetical protein [Bradyrhizobium sp. CCGB20]|nr:hypothetical protein [Bradyrhizobium sp. CCGB20]MCP3400429.1 hypothetical protein [Bradyrhizobium sp. CCGB20]
MTPDPVLTHIVALLVGLLIGSGVTAFFTIRAALKDIRELSAKAQS